MKQLNARQRGLASLEFTLIAPFIIALAALAFLNTRYMLLRQHNAVEARTIAWEHARFGNLSPCIRLGEDEFGGRWGRVTGCRSSSENSDDFIDRFASGSQDLNAFGGTIRGDGGIPRTTVLEARGEYTPAAIEGRFINGRLTANIVEQHAVDLDPIRWHRDPLAIGYDSYLNDELDSDHIFTNPNYFPNAR